MNLLLLDDESVAKGQRVEATSYYYFVFGHQIAVSHNWYSIVYLALNTKQNPSIILSVIMWVEYLPPDHTLFAYLYYQNAEHEFYFSALCEKHLTPLLLVGG